MFSTVRADIETPCLTESESPICDDHNIYNGYFWNGYWIVGLINQETQMAVKPPLIRGAAVLYAPTVMEATAKYRGFSLDGYLGGVSILTCSEIGSSVWLKRLDNAWEGPYLVVDCSRRNDMEGQIRSMNLAVELDFNTAVRWGMAEYGGNGNDGYNNVGRWTFFKPVIQDILVSKYPPPYIKINSAVNILDWFESIVQYAEPKDDLYRLLYRYPRTWRIEGTWVTFLDVIYPKINGIFEAK